MTAIIVHSFAEWTIIAENIPVSKLNINNIYHSEKKLLVSGILLFKTQSNPGHLKDLNIL